MEFNVGDKVLINDNVHAKYLIGGTGTIEDIHKRSYGYVYCVRLETCVRKVNRIDLCVNMEAQKISLIPDNNRDASRFLLYKEFLLC